jgi:Tfp pilus assembly protein PilO
MFQFILPIFLIFAAVGVFFAFTKAKLASIDDYKVQVAEYQKAVDSSTVLLKRRDDLLDIKNKINKSDLDRLDILMPDDVNSTKLILEIENLATRVHGLAFENPKYDPNKKVTPDTRTTPATTDGKTSPPVVNQKDIAQSSKEYGTFELEFTIIGSYENFITFIGDIEKSLRVVDITQVDITQKEGLNLKYIVKVQTYWLKS